MEDILELEKENEQLKEKVNRVEQQTQKIVKNAMGPGDAADILRDYFILQTKLDAMKEIIPEMKDMKDFEPGIKESLDGLKEEIKSKQQKQHDQFNQLQNQLKKKQTDKEIKFCNLLRKCRLDCQRQKVRSMTNW